MTMKEVLTRARAKLASGAWTQGALERNGQFCAVGAIRAVGEGPAKCNAITFLHSVIREDWLYATVTEWNDVQGRTLETVLETFDRAIARL